MAVSYKKLWKLLIDHDMKKKDLQEKAGLSQYAIRKLSNNESVTTDTLAKICRTLNCSVDEIIDIMPETSGESVLQDCKICKKVLIYGIIMKKERGEKYDC